MTKERVSVALVREIRHRLAAGMTKLELRRECGVQNGQLKQLLANGTSLRTPALDGLCAHLTLELLPAIGGFKPCSGLAPTEALQRAIVDERTAGATLLEICQAAEVSYDRVREFVLGKRSLNLKTFDSLCGVLGLELVLSEGGL